MHYSAVLISALAILSPAFGRFDWEKTNGKTKLRGNSFGISYTNQTFDYVIIGGGTAGLAVANRLAKDSSITVAVVEAGAFYEFDNRNTSQVPGYGGTYLSFNDLEPNYQRVDWDLITSKQKGFNDRRIHYTAGRTLDGSSALNDMIFHRYPLANIIWITEADDVLLGPQKGLFSGGQMQSVTFTPPSQETMSSNVSITYDQSAFNNSGSPLQVSYSNYRQPFDIYLEKTFAKSGLSAINGHNSGELHGHATATLTIDPPVEVRSSSEESFLQDALETTALKVFVNTQAQKITFDENKVATGVIVETNGGVYTLSANKEIIVSAGVFHSPQVLILSGIGPAAQLEKHGIPVVSDLHGMGNNLLDQVFIINQHQVNITTNSGILSNPALAAVAGDEYLNEQNGPLAGIGGGIIAFEKVPNRTALTTEALAELDSLPSDWIEAEYLGLSTGAKPAEDPLGNNYVYSASSIFAPFPHGYVNLSSSNPSDPPIINPNGLSSDTEAQLGVQAIRRMREFATGIGIYFAELSPGVDVQTDAELTEWLRNNGVNGYHAAFSCGRMGAPNDQDAVIDSKARADGVQGLRVVDASSFPILPPGHPISTIYALAIKIAEGILADK